MLNDYFSKIMDYKKYSEELETIIAAIDMHEHQRILVNALMKAAKEQCECDTSTSKD